MSGGNRGGRGRVVHRGARVGKAGARGSGGRPNVGQIGRKRSLSGAPQKNVKENMESKKEDPVREKKLMDKSPEDKECPKNSDPATGSKISNSKKKPKPKGKKRFRKDSTRSATKVTCPIDSSSVLLTPPVTPENPKLEEIANPQDDVNCPDDVKVSCFVSCSTGLHVFSARKDNGEAILAADRARLVKHLSGVVLMDVWGNGESLLCGADIGDSSVEDYFEKAKKELVSWVLEPYESGGQDPYISLAASSNIPKVDGLGLYQLVVKVGSLSKRHQLLAMISNFNVLKVAHGAGESIIQVGHLLELLAYEEVLKASFHVEKRHYWKSQAKKWGGSKPTFHNKSSLWLWARLSLMETPHALTTAHEQYWLFHQLRSAGLEVLHLEHRLAGAPNNYLVVISLKTTNAEKVQSSLTTLGTQFKFLEISPDYLPEKMRPTYLVDDDGFYTVAGKFPSLLADAKNKFAEDMKNIGAVGFRTEETCPDTSRFTLHFVNSRCLERISNDDKFKSFKLSIQSKKVVPEKSSKLLIPTPVKLKEIRSLKCPKSSSPGPVSPVKFNVYSQSSKADVSASLPSDTNEDQTVEVKSTSPEDLQESPGIKEGKVRKNSMGGAKSLERNTSSNDKSERNIQNEESTDVSKAVLSEKDLLSIEWKEKKNLQKSLGALADFLMKFPEVEIGECNGVTYFNFKNASKLGSVLSEVSTEATNTYDKLKGSSQLTFVNPSTFNPGKYGLIVPKEAYSQVRLEYFGKGKAFVECRGWCLVLWFSTKYAMFQAFVEKFRKSSYSCRFCSNNFQSLEKFAEESLLEEVPESPATATPFKLVEEEIFSFAWKTERKDKSEEKSFSRLMTTFIKTLKCSSLSATDDGLIAAFKRKEDLENALKRYCREESDSLEKLEGRKKGFNFLPLKGAYGLFSVKRVKPEDFARFGNCKIVGSSIWFTNKLGLVQALRDPYILRTYPALWVDCRNIRVSDKTSDSILKTSTRPTPEDSKNKEQAQNLLDGAIVSAGLVTSVKKTVDPKAPLSVLFPSHEKFRKVSSSKAAKMISSLLEGPREDQVENLKEAKKDRVEVFLKDKLGIKSMESLIETTEDAGGNEKAKPFEENPIESDVCNDIDVELQNENRDKSPKEIEKEREEFEKEAFIYPDDLDTTPTISRLSPPDNLETLVISQLPELEVESLEEAASPPDAEGQTPREPINAPDSVSDKITVIAIPFLKSDVDDEIEYLENILEDFKWFSEDVQARIEQVGEGCKEVLVEFGDQCLNDVVMEGLCCSYPAMYKRSIQIVNPDEKGMFSLVFTDEKKFGYSATKLMFEKYGKPIIKKGASKMEVIVCFPTSDEALSALENCRENCPDLRPHVKR